MAGVGQADEPLVSAGASAQPLVTAPDLSVTSTPAVENLVNAMHQGYVNTDDIVNRIGQQATAQKKATLEALKEYVDPDMVEARMSQARLQAAQNEAQKTLVAPATQLGAATIAKNLGTISNGDAINLGQQWFGTVKDAQGNPDYDATANLGRQVYRQQLRLQQAQQGLAVTQKYTSVEKGQNVEHWLNALGEDVSPGTPAHKAYAQMRQDAWDELYTTPGNLGKSAGGGRGGAASVVSPAGTSPALPLTPTQDQVQEVINKYAPGGDPNQPDQNKILAAIANAYKANPADVSKMDQDQINQAVLHLASPPAPSPVPEPAVVPATPPPETRPVLPVGQSGVGVPLGPAAGFLQKPDEIRADMEKQESYKMWQQQAKAAESFDQTVKDIQENASKPPSEQKPWNALDFQLAESAVALYQPQMAIREFKWSELTKGQPITEIVKNWKQIVGRTGELTPEGRQRLISLGYSMIDGADNAARGPIGGAVNAATQAGLNPNQVLTNDDEKRVFNKQPFGQHRPLNNLYSGQPNAGAGTPSGGTPYPAGAPQGLRFSSTFNKWYDPRTGATY